jgi:hypothetical protein
VSMHEAKAFTCNVRPGRLRNVRKATPVAVASRAHRDDPIPDTPDCAQPEGRQMRKGWRR